MKMIIRSTITLLLLFSIKFSFANDGAFYTAGNHLIPMYETSISVKKEILSLKRVDKDFVNVTVYYEFFNPGESKTVEVGFEAASPSGDVDATPIKGKHPNIYNLTVNMNNEILPYSVAIVSDSIYYKNNVFIVKKVTELDGGNYVDFNYVYHFKAHFKKGLNIITHTYKYDLSGSVYIDYEINYILTAAKRWSNKQIDDFTLIIDMGTFADFNISRTFFTDEDEWIITGIGKTSLSRFSRFHDTNEVTMSSIIREGFLVYQKKNFKPMGELILFSPYPEVFYSIEANQGFDYKKFNTPIQIELSTSLLKATNETSLKILRNLPYARRGYIFKSPEIQKYYEGMEWYIPDPNYEADLSKVTLEEQEWLKKLSLE